MSKITPRGLRNNNPGNIRLTKTVWAGQIIPGTDRSFCQFQTMAYGYRAMLMTLRNYRRKHGCQTVADFIRRWAPPVENDTAAYIRSVCRTLQVHDSYIPDIDVMSSIRLMKYRFAPFSPKVGMRLSMTFVTSAKKTG